MLKQPNFFYSQPSILPKDTPVKFYLSTGFGLSFMISSVAPTRSSTFYAYLITKIGNRNLKQLVPNVYMICKTVYYASMPKFKPFGSVVRQLLARQVYTMYGRVYTERRWTAFEIFPL